MSDVISRGSCPSDSNASSYTTSSGRRGVRTPVRGLRRILTDADGEELARRVDALDVDQAQAALRYLALGIGGRMSADIDELVRAIRHGESWH
jgi:hypothetical protein